AQAGRHRRVERFRARLAAGQPLVAGAPAALKPLERRAGSPRGLLHLLPFLAPYRLRVLLALLFLLGAATATLIVPYGLRLLIDGGLAAGDDTRLAVIRNHFLILLGLALLMAAFTSARFYMVSWLGERVTTDLRQAVYANVLRQRPVFFETLQTGEVLS